MAETAPAATAGATNGQPAGTAQTTTASQSVTLTQEQLKAMIDENKNAIFAEARRFFETPHPAKLDKKPDTDAAQTLREQVAELQADKIAERNERRLLEVEKAAAKAGVDAARLDIFVDHVLSRHGERIQVDGRKVVWLDNLDQPQTLDTLIADVMKTRGDIFRPAAKVPTARALQSGNQQQRQVQQPDAVAAWENLTPADKSKLSPAELRTRAAAAVTALREG
jgi:hypothetical protein